VTCEGRQRRRRFVWSPFVLIVLRTWPWGRASFVAEGLLSRNIIFGDIIPSFGGMAELRILDFGLVAMGHSLDWCGRRPRARDHRSRLCGLVEAIKKRAVGGAPRVPVGRGELPTARSSRLDAAGMNRAARWRFHGAHFQRILRSYLLVRMYTNKGALEIKTKVEILAIFSALELPGRQQLWGEPSRATTLQRPRAKSPQARARSLPRARPVRFPLAAAK
jgi:hypothetical protein